MKVSGFPFPECSGTTAGKIIIPRPGRDQESEARSTLRRFQPYRNFPEADMGPEYSSRGSVMPSLHSVTVVLRDLFGDGQGEGWCGDLHDTGGRGGETFSGDQDLPVSLVPERYHGVRDGRVESIHRTIRTVSQGGLRFLALFSWSP